MPRTMAEIQQVDAARPPMGWHEQQKGNYFQTPEPQYLAHNTETQLPHSRFKTHIILHDS